MKIEYKLASLAVMAWASLILPAEARAQEPGPARQTPQSPNAATAASDGTDIIVTARRRNETALDAPVVLTAFSGEQLARLAVTNITDVAKMTPMLVIAPAQSVYGGNLTLRGVASPQANANSEPAVTINVDGIPLSYGGVVRLANIDVGQIEILKGPQALFFGKNSTGGIVSIRSAEPTRTYQSQFSAGYEFNARQVDLDGYVSGPVADTLELRVAGRFSRQRGYFTNVAPVRTFDYGPGTKEEGVRLSANWHPNDQLMVKLRATYHNMRENGSYATNQTICPYGFAQGAQNPPGTDDCTLNDTIVYGPLPSAQIRAVTGNPAWDTDRNYFKSQQTLVSADISYKLSDSVTLNSVTGVYGIHLIDKVAATTGALFRIGFLSLADKEVFTEELRLSYKSPDSPIDLMIGGFYLKDKFRLQEQGVNGIPTLSALSPFWDFPTRSNAISAFGQIGWDFAPRFNLSAGVRYSRDRKYLDVVVPAGLPDKFNQRSVEFSNWSPETTLSFKPNDDANLFVSFREGYKAGAYQIGFGVYNAPLANPNVTSIAGYYKPETVKGFEGGLKVRLLDRQLRLNLAAYSYEYKDLQLSQFNPATVASVIINASSARVKGLEGDFSFSPRGVPGLTITGAAAYNSAKYDSPFLGACYVGQTIAEGCTISVIAGTNVAQQQFLGRPLPRAPKYSFAGGLTYDTSVGESSKATFTFNAIYTSKQYLSQELKPEGFAPRRVLIDSAVSFGSQSGSYEVSLIGRNLTDKHFGYSGAQPPGGGSGTGTAVGVRSDYSMPTSRGREIWVKLTLRPSAF